MCASIRLFFVRIQPLYPIFILRLKILFRGLRRRRRGCFLRAAHWVRLRTETKTMTWQKLLAHSQTRGPKLNLYKWGFSLPLLFCTNIRETCLEPLHTARNPAMGDAVFKMCSGCLRLSFCFPFQFLCCAQNQVAYKHNQQGLYRSGQTYEKYWFCLSLCKLEL